jgi:hypothetical protein
MTATLNPPSAETALWGTMPGWGIAADLTPPELVEARRLKVLRKAIAAALLLVVVLCIAGYALAFLKHRSASHDLDAARDRSRELTLDQQKYSKVTQIQAMTTTVNSQLTSLAGKNVDVAMLFAHMRDALPNTMSLTAMNATISGAEAGTNTAPSLDTSGHAVVGTVTLSGSSQRLVDLANYVTALAALKGVVNVVPSSNSTATAGTAQWNITLQLTDVLYTQPSTTGGN